MPRRPHARRSSQPAATMPDVGLVEALPTAAFVVDAEGRPSRWNALALELWGRPPADDADRYAGPHRLARPDGAPVSGDATPAARALRGETVRGEALVAARDDGVRLALAVDAAPLRDGDGEVAGAVVVLRQREATDAEARLAAALAAARIGTWHWDAASDAIAWDTSLRRVVGLDAVSPIPSGRDFAQWIHPDDRERAGQAIAAAISGSGDYDVEFRLRHGDGSWHWHRSRGRVAFAGGAPTSMIGACIDVTELREAERALAESEARFRGLAEHLPHLVWLAGADGRIAYANRPFLALLGSIEAARDAQWRDLYHPDDYDQLMATWRAGIEAGLPFRAEARLKRRDADGPYRWHEVRADPRRDAEGRIVEWVGTFTDVDDRRAALDLVARAADRRAASVEERFRLLVSAVRDYAIFMLDADGRVATWNDGAQRIKGYDEHEIIGQPYERFFPPEAIAAGVPARQLARTRDEGSAHFEGWRVRKDGTRFWANVVLTALRDDAGVLRGYAKVTRDETDRHRVLGELNDALTRARAAEEALRAHADLLEERVRERTRQLTEHADRLQRSNAELERFAYVASHDLKEPLRMVTQYVGLLKQRLGTASREDLERYAGHAVTGATRMLELIEGLLEYSRVEHDGLELGEVDVARVVEELRDLLDVAFAEAGGRLETGPLPTLRADRARLAQVLQNLIGNALKYRVEGRPPVVRLTAERDADAWRFDVADNGIGIAPQHLEEVFEPFRRLHTYAQRPGAGVGLAICRRIVELHGGRIWAGSTPGEGSTFRFTIPDAAPRR